MCYIRFSSIRINTYRYTTTTPSVFPSRLVQVTIIPVASNLASEFTVFISISLQFYLKNGGNITKMKNAAGCVFGFQSRNPSILHLALTKTYTKTCRSFYFISSSSIFCQDLQDCFLRGHGRDRSSLCYSYSTTSICEKKCVS